MLHTPFPRPETPASIVRDQLAEIPMQLAEAFRRAPIGFIILLVMAVVMPVVSASGIAGGFGLPFWLALPIGVLGVALQIDSYVKLRARTGKRSHNLIILIFVSLCNMISVTAGLVALSPASQGQAMIARQLDPIVGAVEGRAGALEAVAIKFDALAAYSKRRADQEGASAAPEWQATCPASTGPGVGPITTWRLQSGEQAEQLATSLRTAATNSRAAAGRAARAAGAYRPANHEQTMTEINAAVASINAASRAFETGAAAGVLARLGNETAATGICPDLPMQQLLGDILAAKKSVPLAALAFEAPARPSEELAVRDLTNQLIAFATGGTADFTLYRRYLGVAPLADALLMLMLAQVLAPVRRNYGLEAAQRAGIREEDADRIDEAGQAIAHSRDWTAILALRERIKWGPIAFDRVLVREDDYALLFKLRNYAASGAVREGGPDREGNHVFVLRPHFLSELWGQLLRRHFAGPRPQPIAPITIVQGD